jgi:hypothetical protein
LLFFIFNKVLCNDQKWSLNMRVFSFLVIAVIALTGCSSSGGGGGGGGHGESFRPAEYYACQDRLYDIYQDGVYRSSMTLLCSEAPENTYHTKDASSIHNHQKVQIRADGLFLLEMGGDNITSLFGQPLQLMPSVVRAGDTYRDKLCNSGVCLGVQARVLAKLNSFAPSGYEAFSDVIALEITFEIEPTGEKVQRSSYQAWWAKGVGTVQEVASGNTWVLNANWRDSGARTSTNQPPPVPMFERAATTPPSPPTSH